MPIEKITHKITVAVDNRNGRHKVTRQGVIRDSESQLQDTPFNEPVKRADIEAVLGVELSINAEKVTQLSLALDQMEAATAPLQEQLATANQQIAQLNAQIEALTNPPEPTDPLQKPLTKVQFHAAIMYFGATLEMIDMLIDVRYPVSSQKLENSLAKSRLRHANEIYRTDPLWSLIIEADPHTTNETINEAWPVLIATNGGAVIPS